MLQKFFFNFKGILHESKMKFIGNLKYILNQILVTLVKNFENV